MPGRPSCNDDPLRGRRLCRGPTCPGGVWHPTYYITPAGLCLDCAYCQRPPRHPRPPLSPLRDRSREARAGASVADRQDFRARRRAAAGEVLAVLDVAGVSEPARRTLRQFYFDGMTQEVIAALPSDPMTVRGVQKRLQRARDRLAAVGVMVPLRQRQRRPVEVPLTDAMLASATRLYTGQVVIPGLEVERRRVKVGEDSGTRRERFTWRTVVSWNGRVLDFDAGRKPWLNKNRRKAK